MRIERGVFVKTSYVKNEFENESCLTDYEVVKKCINGKEHYFEILIKRYKNLVYSVILKMTNDSEEANDLAQEVFIKIYKNLDKYSEEYKFSTWVIRITTNHIIDYRRKKKHETVPIDEVVYDLSTENSPEKQYIIKEEKQRLHNLVNELPDIYKVPILLYHQNGLSYQEIADATNESLSKVKNRIFRGRKMLKNSLLKMREGAAVGLQKN